jgi:hypothetical protein
VHSDFPNTLYYTCDQSPYIPTSGSYIPDVISSQKCHTKIVCLSVVMKIQMFPKVHACIYRHGCGQQNPVWLHHNNVFVNTLRRQELLHLISDAAGQMNDANVVHKVTLHRQMGWNVQPKLSLLNIRLNYT